MSHTPCGRINLETGPTTESAKFKTSAAKPELFSGKTDPTIPPRCQCLPHRMVLAMCTADDLDWDVGGRPTRRKVLGIRPR